MSITRKHFKNPGSKVPRRCFVCTPGCSVPGSCVGSAGHIEGVKIVFSVCVCNHAQCNARTLVRKIVFERLCRNQCRLAALFCIIAFCLYGKKVNRVICIAFSFRRCAFYPYSHIRAERLFRGECLCCNKAHLFLGSVTECIRVCPVLVKTFREPFPYRIAGVCTVFHCKRNVLILPPVVIFTATVKKNYNFNLHCVFRKIFNNACFPLFLYLLTFISVRSVKISVRYFCIKFVAHPFLVEPRIEREASALYNFNAVFTVPVCSFGYGGRSAQFSVSP
ncbi:hypothetical protein TRPE111910_11670 [Treponema peruense]